MATTVTETYIIERNIGPASAALQTRINAALSSGALISNTVTEITDPEQAVAGKIKFNVARVWRSEVDRTSFNNNEQTDTEYLSWLTGNESRRINETIS
jgi:hypothetical protein